MSEHPFGAQGPFRQPQQAWQQPEPTAPKTDIRRLEDARAEQQRSGLQRVGGVVLGGATAIMVIVVILVLMIYAWSSGFFLSLFEDPALQQYLKSAM
ncbi:hypothetical protein [Corynebacterium sp.]|uniref:hypothetical protein n=1 Tax=Corynebacterium sp. TaxID=1720 RepID=UPI0026DDA948|nr:hypothetical protein [Corynebacterium sp.]MDO5076853.1 hypothetical protein [Corynebacterium sp.]